MEDLPKKVFIFIVVNLELGTRNYQLKVLSTTTSEASGSYAKSLQGLEDHFSPQNDHNNHLAIIKLIHFPDAHDQN